MVKYYCDRCGKEADKLTTVKIPIQKLNDGSFGCKTLDLCKECEDEANELFDTLADIRISMFSKYLKKVGKTDTEKGK